MIERINKRALLIALVVATPFAGWAYFVNAEHGTFLAARAGGVQYLASSSLSFIMYSLVDVLRGFSMQRVVQLAAMTTLPSGFVLALMIIGHWAVGTPDVLESVAMSAVLAPISCFLYGIPKFEN